MSGPFRCSTCGGCGQIEVGWDADGLEILEPCYECNGTGETWWFITDPNRPRGPKPKPDQPKGAT